MDDLSSTSNLSRFSAPRCSIFVRIAVKSGLNSQHTTREIIFENGPTAGLPGFPMGLVGLIGNH